MKNKILAMLVAFGLVGSVSAIEINENLSINGFIDGSISKTDNAAAGTDEADWGIDEIEVNFLFNVGSVSGQVDVDTEDADNDSGLSIEQAHFTYSLENGISLTFGRYGSALGLEREDPAGLYTFSRAYGNAFNLGDADTHVSEGLKISYAADVWSIGVSIENPTGTIRTSGAAKNDLDFEVALAYTGVENLNVGIGFFSDNQDTAASEVDVTNIHATYQVGKALLGAEYTQRDGNGVAKGDLDATMFLIDYDVSDKLGVAVRYSTYENGTAGVDVDTFTVAPNYALTDSLGAILEYSDTNAAAGDSDVIALELTYTF
jgi:hypothetical protein